MFVLNFADKARVDVPFTSDVHVLEAGIARVDSIGGTAMHDALNMGEEYVRHGKQDRQVLLVITDGNDNASQLTLSQVEQQAEQQEIVVYAIGLTGDAQSTNRMRDDLDRLTERTGGLAYYPTSIDRVGAVALAIARQI